MPLKRKNKGKNFQTKMPTSEYSPADLVRTVADIDVRNMTPNKACLALMERNLDLLAKWGNTPDSWNKKWGQISGGVRSTLDKHVDTNPEVYDMAVAAGLEPTNTRPGGPKQEISDPVPEVMDVTTDTQAEGAVQETVNG